VARITRPQKRAIDLWDSVRAEVTAEPGRIERLWQALGRGVLGLALTTTSLDLCAPAFYFAIANRCSWDKHVCGIEEIVALLGD